MTLRPSAILPTLLGQLRKLDAELIEIGVVLGGVVIVLAHLRAEARHGVPVDLDLRLVARGEQRLRPLLDVHRTWAEPLPRLRAALLMWWTAPAPGIEVP